MENYNQYIPFWVAGIDSGYFKTPAWVAWAEKHVVSKEPTRFWLVDLYQTTDPQEAKTYLLNGLNEDPPPTAFDDWTGAELGFLYIRYLRGELGMGEFLKTAGGVADVRNYDYPSCEGIYQLLTRYECLPAGFESEAQLLIEVDATFLRHWTMVTEWLSRVGLEEEIRHG